MPFDDNCLFSSDDPYVKNNTRLARDGVVCEGCNEKSPSVDDFVVSHTNKADGACTTPPVTTTRFYHFCLVASIAVIFSLALFREDAVTFIIGGTSNLVLRSESFVERRLFHCEKLSKSLRVATSTAKQWLKLLRCMEKDHRSRVPVRLRDEDPLMLVSHDIVLLLALHADPAHPGALFEAAMLLQDGETLASRIQEQQDLEAQSGVVVNDEDSLKALLLPILASRFANLSPVELLLSVDLELAATQHRGGLACDIAHIAEEWLTSQQRCRRSLQPQHLCPGLSKEIADHLAKADLIEEGGCCTVLRGIAEWPQISEESNIEWQRVWQHRLSQSKDKRCSSTSHTTHVALVSPGQQRVGQSHLANLVLSHYDAAGGENNDATTRKVVYRPSRRDFATGTSFYSRNSAAAGVAASTKSGSLATVDIESAYAGPAKKKNNKNKNNNNKKNSSSSVVVYDTTNIDPTVSAPSSVDAIFLQLHNRSRSRIARVVLVTTRHHALDVASCSALRQLGRIMHGACNNLLLVINQWSRDDDEMLPEGIGLKMIDAIVHNVSDLLGCHRGTVKHAVQRMNMPLNKSIASFISSAHLGPSRGIKPPQQRKARAGVPMLIHALNSPTQVLTGVLASSAGFGLSLLFAALPPQDMSPKHYYVPPLFSTLSSHVVALAAIQAVDAGSATPVSDFVTNSLHELDSALALWRDDDGVPGSFSRISAVLSSLLGGLDASVSSLRACEEPLLRSMRPAFQLFGAPQELGKSASTLAFKSGRWGGSVLSLTEVETLCSSSSFFRAVFALVLLFSASVVVVSSFLYMCDFVLVHTMWALLPTRFAIQVAIMYHSAFVVSAHWSGVIETIVMAGVGAAGVGALPDIPVLKDLGFLAPAFVAVSSVVAGLRAQAPRFIAELAPAQALQVFAFGLLCRLGGAAVTIVLVLVTWTIYTLQHQQRSVAKLPLKEQVVFLMQLVAVAVIALSAALSNSKSWRL